MLPWLSVDGTYGYLTPPSTHTHA